jgi:hypothetical protein
VPTLRLYVLYGSQNKQQLLPYKTLRDWFLWPKWRVFTARYALSPYIKQIRFVFKGLILLEVTNAQGFHHQVKYNFQEKAQKLEASPSYITLRLCHNKIFFFKICKNIKIIKTIKYIGLLFRIVIIINFIHLCFCFWQFRSQTILWIRLYLQFTFPYVIH